MFTGSESPVQKEEARQAFLSDQGSVLIMSLRAGAGIDGLQHKCRTVVFGELDWSPGVHEQCVGRIHRDGQPDPVVAYFLVSDFGADPIIVDVLGVKRAQIDGVRDPNAALVEAGRGRAAPSRETAAVARRNDMITDDVTPLPPPPEATPCTAIAGNEPPDPDEAGPSRLEQHAERELRAAGLFDADSDYDGAIGRDVMELVRAFCNKGHSGGSAMYVLEVFNRVARWEALTPITCKPDEWMDIANIVLDQKPAELWQSRRNPALFSVDGGRTYYHVDERDFDKPPRCGRPLRTQLIEGTIRRLYASQDPSAPVTETDANAVQPPAISNATRPTWERVIEMCEKWASSHPIDQVVIADMRERDKLGRERYGTPLQPHNGRDTLVDLYQEQLDSVAYLANAILERGDELDSMVGLGETLWRTIAFASKTRQLIMERDGQQPFITTTLADGRPET
jgi:hypothetical protein